VRAVPGYIRRVLLFQKKFHEGLVSGRVTLTFRRWAKPHVKPGGRYRCHPIGVLEVSAVARVLVRDIMVGDAVASGFESVEELLAYMAGASDEPLLATTEVFRVDLRHGGDGDRVEAAMDDALGPDDVAALVTKLERLDAAAPWTRATLAAIEAAPRVAASKLAVKLGRDRDELKIDIRKLKRLGLTQSFEVGYELSPRGRAFLAAAPKPKRRAPAAASAKKLAKKGAKAPSPKRSAAPTKAKRAAR
jgi:hypothetical protein